MTTIVLALILVIGCTLGLGVVIWLIGTYATVGVRLEHQREMVKLSEQQKLNALTIRERDIVLTERQMGMIETVSVAPIPSPPPYPVHNPDRPWSQRVRGWD